MKKNEEKVQLNNIPTKKVIAVWGNPGVGKSTFTTQIGLLLAENSDSKVLVMDFNTINPSLDHYFGISKQPSNISYLIDDNKEAAFNTSLNYSFDAIERGIFDQNILREIVIEHPKYNNLHILTGNYLLNVFEMLNSKHFSSIIDNARKIYDILIIDINSVIFVDATLVTLKNADVIYTLTEADYTSLREINKSITYLNTLIPKEKFRLIINKYSKKHLDKITINQIVNDYKITGFIDYNEKHISSKINKTPFVTSCKNADKKEYLKIVEEILNI